MSTKKPGKGGKEQETLVSLFSKPAVVSKPKATAPSRVVLEDAEVHAPGLSMKKPVKLAKGQETLLALFSKPTDTPVTTTAAVTDRLTSTDAEVQAFYDSLTPRETIAHRIALTPKGLGTSYDVRRTNGFLKWQKARA